MGKVVEILDRYIEAKFEYLMRKSEARSGSRTSSRLRLGVLRERLQKLRTQLEDLFEGFEAAASDHQDNSRGSLKKSQRVDD